jgi:hypothetical protein
MKTLSQQYFNEFNLKGKESEHIAATWLRKYFEQNNLARSIVDTSGTSSGIYRDADNNQIPDLKVINQETGEFYFVEVKQRKSYWFNKKRTFGISEKFLKSYKNIADKYNCNVYILFHDVESHPNTVFLVNVKQAPDGVVQYKNNWGTEPSYRWYLDTLKKFSI